MANAEVSGPCSARVQRTAADHCAEPRRKRCFSHHPQHKHTHTLFNHPHTYQPLHLSFSPSSTNSISDTKMQLSLRTYSSAVARPATFRRVQIPRLVFMRAGTHPSQAVSFCVDLGVFCSAPSPYQGLRESPRRPGCFCDMHHTPRHCLLGSPEARLCWEAVLARTSAAVTHSPP